MLDAKKQGLFRPLVKSAWHRHCAEAGLVERDPVARDRWYRDQLLSACGIRSTREANDRDFDEILRRFRLLAGDVGEIDIPGLSPSQSKIVNRLMRAAWDGLQSSENLPGGVTFRQWAEGEASSAGEPLSYVSPIHGFDVLAAHFAVLSGDEYWIDHLSQAAEIRMRHVIRGLLNDLSELTGEFHDWNYCRAIYEQMDLPLTIDEASAKWLLKVLQALDTHVRKIRKQGAPATGHDTSVPF